MGGDVALPYFCAAGLVIVGFFLLLKMGSKIGWVFLAAAVIWGYVLLKPVVRQAQTGGVTPEQNRRGYYRKAPQ